PSPRPAQPAPRRRPATERAIRRETWEAGGAPAVSARRELTAYERAILARLLDADLPPETRPPGTEWGSVVQIDRCGCLAFVPMTRAPEPGSVLVVEGRGPQDRDGVPLEVVLTIRDGRPIW